MISLKPLNSDQLKLISHLEHNEDVSGLLTKFIYLNHSYLSYLNKFDVWTRVKLEDHNVVICLSPDAFIKYKPFFEIYKIEFEIYEENLQRQVLNHMSLHYVF